MVFAMLFASSAQAALIQVEIAGNADSVTIDGDLFTNLPYVISFSADDSEPSVEPGRFQPELAFSLDFPGVRDLGSSSSHAIIDIVQSTGGLLNLDVSSGPTFLTLGDFGGFRDLNVLLAFERESPLAATVSDFALLPEIVFENGTTQQFRDAAGGALTVSYVSVPEPGRAWLLGIGAVCLLGLGSPPRRRAATRERREALEMR